MSVHNVKDSSSRNWEVVRCRKFYRESGVAIELGAEKEKTGAEAVESDG